VKKEATGMNERQLTAPVSMSNIRAPRLHQSTALPWPLRINISGALHTMQRIPSFTLQTVAIDSMERDATWQGTRVPPPKKKHCIKHPVRMGDLVGWNLQSKFALQNAEKQLQTTK